MLFAQWCAWQQVSALLLVVGPIRTHRHTVALFFPVSSRCLDDSEYDQTDLIDRVSAFALYLPVDDAVAFDALATFAEYMDTDFSG